MRKENLILGGVFIFLLILAFAFEPMMDWKKNLSRPDNFLGKAKMENIIKVGIEKNGDKINLERQGDKWKIAEAKDFYVMDKDDIFVSYLEEAINGNMDLVSNNKEKKSGFQTDDSGTHVILEDNEGVVADFIIGRVSNDFSGTYVSLPDSDETYRVDGVVATLFNRNVNDWYDLTVLENDVEKVNKIRFQYPNSEFTVEKKDDVWKGVLPYSFRVDQDKIDEIARLMTDLNAVEVPAQTFDGTGLEKHSIIIEISGDGVSDVLMIGDKNEDGNYFAKKGSSDNIYLISSEQKEILDTSIRGLR